jgi:hypothetical protein
MKTPAYPTRNCFAVLLLSGMLAAAFPTSAQPTLYGPQKPPPKESSILFTGTESDGQIGRAGGKVYTISNITLSNTTTVYWSMLENSIKLSMDGSLYSSYEVLTLNAGLTNLPGGVITWSGTTYIRWWDIGGQAWRTTQLFSRFVVTVTHADNSPVPLVAPANTGLNSSSGGSVFITGSAMVFKVRMQMLVAESSGGPYYPHLDYYDAKHTDGVLAYSTYDYGFYWENDPPQLKTNTGATVDEADTVTINHTHLAATDVESSNDQIFIIIDPLEKGTLPAHGALSVDGVPVVAKHTLTMTDMMTKTIRYVHDDSETVRDSIAFSVYDSDGAACKVGGDSVFYFILTITPIDDPPVLEINTGATVDEGASLTLTADHLLATDPESGADKVTYTLDPEGNSEFPKNGLLKLNGVPLGDGGTFTQADLSAGKVVYTHNGSETLSDGFVFKVTDEFGHPASNNGSNNFFFEITVNPVNDDPILTKNLPLVILQGGTGIISNALLTATDAESPPAEIKFTIDPKVKVENPLYGEVRLNGTVLNDTEGFTMADVNNNVVTYVHDGSENHTDFFVFNVTDPHGGMTRDGEFTEFQFRINITNVNDPPLLVNPIADRQIRADEPFSFIFPENTFEDVDAGDMLTYTSFTYGEEALPAWLTFDAGLRKYSGTPAVANKGLLTVILQATDTELATARDTFDIEVISPVTTGTAQQEEIVEIGPVPFSDMLNIQIHRNTASPARIIIYNLLGEKIIFHPEAGSQKTEIDMRPYASGLYFIRVELDNETILKKVLKQ